MFYGTRFFYKFLYFITAMAPAYFLFLLQIDDKFHQPFDTKILTMRINIYGWCALLLFFIVILVFSLKFILTREHLIPSTDPVIGAQKEKFKSSNLKEINGSTISFLLGNILPAVLIIEGNLYAAILTFFLIQFLIYTLIIRSTDIFPNVFLILLGINLCKTDEDDYVFTFRSKKYQYFDVYQIGDPLKSRLFITMYEK